MIPIAVVCFTISLIVGLYFGGVFDSSDGSGSGTKTGTGSGSLSTTPSTSRSSPDPAIAAAIAERIRNGGNNTGSTTQPNTDCKPFQNTGTSLMSYLSSLTSSNGVKTSDIHKKPDSTSTGLQCDEAIYKLNSDTSDYFYAYDKINDKVVIVNKNDPALTNLNTGVNTSTNNIHYQSPLTRNVIKNKYANATFYDATQNTSDCDVFKPGASDLAYKPWVSGFKTDYVYRIGAKGGKNCANAISESYSNRVGRMTADSALPTPIIYDKKMKKVVEHASRPSWLYNDDVKENVLDSYEDGELDFGNLLNNYENIGNGWCRPANSTKIDSANTLTKCKYACDNNIDCKGFSYTENDGCASYEYTPTDVGNPHNTGHHCFKKI